MNINIRKAEQADCSKMMELIKELALYEKAPEEVTVSFDHFVSSGFGPNPVWWAYVAELTHENQSKTIVGFALYYIRYSTWKGQRMYLEDIIVTETMRGKGIGKMLFEQLIEVCKELNFKGMTWQVLDWNEPAINFYKKFEGVSLDGSWLNGSIK
ncbi:MAG: GNAT family N-acetyltransferase [Bacteroidota bacterium]